MTVADAWRAEREATEEKEVCRKRAGNGQGDAGGHLSRQGPNLQASRTRRLGQNDVPVGTRSGHSQAL